MERLTKRLDNGEPALDCKNCELEQGFGCGYRLCIERLLARVADYEDTKLTPPEVRSMSGEWRAMMAVLNSIGSYDRLRELAEADKDGRVVVFPKQGSTVYYIGGALESHVIAGVLIDSGLERLKATVMPDARNYLVEVPVSSLFTSREEAEKALAEREGKT